MASALHIPDLSADAIIKRFGMIAHPEGGWYAETFRAPAAPGERSAVTAIYFLLQQGERSHWHTVDASEIWLWHAGSPIRLHISVDGEEAETLLLGPALEAGERPQFAVPQGAWQSAESAGAWSLASCVVAPGFQFSGFTLAPAGWAPHG